MLRLRWTVLLSWGVLAALTVTDTLTHQVKTYNNPRGQLASRADIGAF